MRSTKLLDQERELAKSELVECARGLELAVAKLEAAVSALELAVQSGATKWNDPKEYPWTMGWPPSYQDEARIYARYSEAKAERQDRGPPSKRRLR
jgi:branched-chain amino acid transport system substrate-binding protein